jgi:hypothetical protein
MSTIHASSNARPARAIVLLRRLLMYDEPRRRPAITLPGRPAAAPPPSKPRTPNLGWARLPGGRKPDWADGDAPRRRKQEQQPNDVLPPYTRDQLAAMNDRFVHRLERAFKSGRERRVSAASHMGGRRMAPIALTDDQLATLRQFATPIPPSWPRAGGGRRR